MVYLDLYLFRYGRFYSPSPAYKNKERIIKRRYIFGNYSVRTCNMAASPVHVFSFELKRAFQATLTLLLLSWVFFSLSSRTITLGVLLLHFSSVFLISIIASMCLCFFLPSKCISTLKECDEFPECLDCCHISFGQCFEDLTYLSVNLFIYQLIYSFTYLFFCLFIYF